MKIFHFSGENIQQHLGSIDTQIQSCVHVQYTLDTDFCMALIKYKMETLDNFGS